MPPTNDFLPFCPTDTGTNLLTESDYAAAADRVSGNKPGIASAKLNNKALRQAAYIASQTAQYIANKLTANVLDDATPAKLLGQFTASLKPYAPVITRYTSGSSTWNGTYIFQIASGNATVGATYTNNAVTFTVVATVAGATEVKMTGAGDPDASTGSGTLTKASGTGDATLTFYAFRKALYLIVTAQGGGGGGAGGGTSASVAAGDGGATTFGSTVVVANGGTKGVYNDVGGSGGTTSTSGPTVLAAISGSSGSDAQSNNGASTLLAGGAGGTSPFGGAGGGGVNTNGHSATSNSGSGGGGGGTNSNALSASGGGGGSGGYVKALISSALSTYAVVVGAAGSAGTANVTNGGAGSTGMLIVEEHFQ